MSSNSPCAACKFQRRKCTPECIFAPYFPPEDPQKFANVHKVFGGSNVSKILSDLNPAQREEAARSLAFEADCRLRDPIYGCVGYIAQLQQRLKQLHFELSNAKEELATYIGPSALLPTFPQHAYNGQMLYNNVPQQQQPLQMIGNNPSTAALPYTNLMGAPPAVYAAGTSQQQTQMMSGGGGNSASALPYTSLMPSVVGGGGGSGAVASSQAVLIHEQQQQHGLVDPQQYGALAVATAAAADHQYEPMRNYDLQQHQPQQLRQQDYLLFKSSENDQYEADGEGQMQIVGSSAAGFIQMGADDDEIGAGPSLALGVNYENPYSNQIHEQQQHDRALQAQLLLQQSQQQQHPDQVLQTPLHLQSQRKTGSDEGRNAAPSC